MYSLYFRYYSSGDVLAFWRASMHYGLISEIKHGKNAPQVLPNLTLIGTI